MPQKHTIYILHGWSVNSENEKKWQAFIEELQNHNIQSVFLGIPGLSSPLDEVWNLDQFVKWLHTQLPEKKSSVLLGHSFGGQIACRFAALYPEKVASLILIDSAGIRDHSIVPTIKRNIFWCAAKIGKLLFPFTFFKILLYKFAREKDYVNAPPLLKRTMSTILDQEVVADLPHIIAQSLIIWGENDRVTPLKLAHIFKKNIQKSKLVIIPQARHSPQFTHVKETVLHIIQFLKKHS